MVPNVFLYLKYFRCHTRNDFMYEYSKPVPILFVSATSLVTYAGERYDFILEANNEIDNYWIRFRGLMDCDER